MNTWELTKETLDKLLFWLDHNREQSGEKYETIRGGLIKIFTCWGCFEAEELADETINRVAKKVETIEQTYTGNPSRYFYGVAKKVHLEYRRKKAKSVPLPTHLPSMTTMPEPSDEITYDCLEQCMQQLTPTNREMVWHYYQQGSSANLREELAKRLGLKLSTLRVKIFRSVTALEDCVKKCVEQGGG